MHSVEKEALLIHVDITILWYCKLATCKNFVQKRFFNYANFTTNVSSTSAVRGRNHAHAVDMRKFVYISLQHIQTKNKTKKRSDKQPPPLPSPYPFPPFQPQIIIFIPLCFTIHWCSYYTFFVFVVCVCVCVFLLCVSVSHRPKLACCLVG